MTLDNPIHLCSFGDKVFLLSIGEHYYYWTKPLYIDQYKKGASTSLLPGPFMYIALADNPLRIMNYSTPEYHRHKDEYDLAIEKLEQYLLLR